MRMNSGIENRYGSSMGGEIWTCCLNCGDTFDKTNNTFLVGTGEVLACFKIGRTMETVFYTGTITVICLALIQQDIEYVNN